MRRFFLPFAILSLAFACSHGEESECSKYVTQLGGDNPKAVFESVSEMKCQDAVPILKDMFDPRQGKYNREILRVISDIWDPSPQTYKAEAEKFAKKKPLYVEILRLALGSPETAVVAASNVEEWKLQELKADLALMLEEDVKSSQPQFALAYAPALRSLSSPEMGGYSEDFEDVYVALLNSSPDIQGIEVNKMSAQALGEIKTKNPEAIKALIRGLFLVSKEGGTVFKESLKSLLQVGSDAVPFLVDIVESHPGDPAVRYMEEFAVKNAISQWKWRKGMRIPMLLAQLRDQRAAAALVVDIARPVIEPPNLPDTLRQDWTIAQTNRIKFDSWALMSIANPAVMEQALKTMRDRNVEGSARLQLSLALAFSFTPEAAETLLSVCHQPELDEDVMTEEEIAKVEAYRAQLGEPAKETDFVIRFLQPLAYSIDYAHLLQFNDIFVEGFDENFGEQEKAEDITEKLGQIDIKVLIGVPKACRKNFECYLSVLRGGPGKIEDNEERYDPDKVEGVDARESEYVRAMARAKAGLVLGRWTPTKEQRAELIKAFANQFTTLPYDDELYGDLRQVILLGFEHLGQTKSKDVLVAVKNLIEKEQKKGVEATKVWNQRLVALQYYLEGYKKPTPGAKAEKKAAEKKADVKEADVKKAAEKK